MRLLHVAHQYRPAIGGSEQHVTNLSEELARRGHQVDVFTTRSTDFRTWRNELPRRERLGGVNVYRFDCVERGPRTWEILDRGLRGYWRTRSSRYAPLIVWGNGPNSPAMVWRLLRWGRRYDLIHTNSLHYANVSYASLVARLLNVPYALTPLVHIDQGGVFDIEFQNEMMRKADLVLTVTEGEKDHLSEREVARDRMVVSGVGIHLDDYPQLDSATCRQRLGLPLEAFLVLFMARKEEYKGLKTLLSACSRLQSECPDLYLIAAGPETEHSQQLRRQFAKTKRVIYYGAVSWQEKLDLLNACDAFALPSTGESFGFVYVEAWAVKKPVVGAHSGAVPSLISDGVDGLLVTPDDPADLVLKIKQLYQDVELRQRLAAAGHAKATMRYTVQRVADIVEGAYRRTIRRYNTCSYGKSRHR
jgi:glycosyltransferase involved in cell wall biosynthesis